MRWLWLIFVVISPAVLYVILLLAAPLYRSRCPKCNRRGLKLVDGYHWKGEQGGGSIVFYECQRCRARLKHDLAAYSDATEEEWRRHVH